MKAFRFWLFTVGVLLLSAATVLADNMVLFDFNGVPAAKKKFQAAAVRSYMQDLYGSDVSVGGKTRLGNTRGRKRRSGSLGAANSLSANPYLINGKGKNGAIVLTFGQSPISSFAVDWGVFRKGSGIIIKADGVVIYQDALTKAERKLGIEGHLDPLFFDHPVQTLEFIGVKKTKLGIDNLAVNIPWPENSFNALGDPRVGIQLVSASAAVPEPPALLLLGIGLIALVLPSRRGRLFQLSAT